MLGASWLACGAIVARLAVPPRLADRAVMGAAALLMLLAAELSLAVLAFGATVAATLGSYCEPARQIGLIGQLAFTLFPLVRIGFETSRRPF